MEEVENEGLVPFIPICTIDWSKPAIYVGGTPARRFTPECVNRILEATRALASQELAAQCGGIADFTLRRWLDLGEQQLKEAIELEDAGAEEQDLTIWSEFYLAFKEAEGATAKELLTLVKAAAAQPCFWAAAMTLLERRFPLTYGRNNQPQGPAVTRLTIEVIERNDWRNVTADPYGEGAVIDSTFHPVAALPPPPPDDISEFAADDAGCWSDPPRQLSAAPSRANDRSLTSET